MSDYSQKAWQAARARYHQMNTVCVIQKHLIPDRLPSAKVRAASEWMASTLMECGCAGSVLLAYDSTPKRKITMDQINQATADFCQAEVPEAYLPAGHQVCWRDFESTISKTNDDQ